MKPKPNVKRKKLETIKPTITVIDLVVYPYDVLFAVGATEQEVIEHLKSKCNYILDDEEKNYLNFTGKGGRTVRLKNNALILWVKNYGLPVLGHEIFHVVELLMEKINVPINEQTSETYAYLIEYLWREIIKPTNQKKKK